MAPKMTTCFGVKVKSRKKSRVKQHWRRGPGLNSRRLKHERWAPVVLFASIIQAGYIAQLGFYSSIILALHHWTTHERSRQEKIAQ